MEGGGIGQVCYTNGTPFFILRAISDNGDEEAQDDFDMSLEMAADRATQVMDRFLANLAVGQQLLQE
jgi:nucleoside phosphorylase